MKKIVAEYGNSDKIRVNYMILSKPREGFRSITRKILEIKQQADLVALIESDGLIYGSIATKIQYKWKPAIATTIDFYVIWKAGQVNLYVGNNIRYVKKKRGFKNWRRNVPFYFSHDDNKNYVNMWFLSQASPKARWSAGDPRNDSSDFNNKIVECRRTHNGIWEPVRTRPLKPNPNYYMTAINNIKILNNPILLEDLI